MEGMAGAMRLPRAIYSCVLVTPLHCETGLLPRRHFPDCEQHENKPEDRVAMPELVLLRFRFGGLLH